MTKLLLVLATILFALAITCMAGGKGKLVLFNSAFNF
jgi:hypothetical protein